MYQLLKYIVLFHLIALTCTGKSLVIRSELKRKLSVLTFSFTEQISMKN